MKISKIHLKNFKRFTDLRIENIPDTAKLVLLIGANGSGKSSVFDAFGFVVSSIIRDISPGSDFFDYYRKKKNESLNVAVHFSANEVVSLSDRGFNKPNLHSTSFYGRTSFRQISRLTRTSLGESRFNIDKDSDRPKFFIEKDNRFENDIEKITEIILKEFFRGKQSNQQITHAPVTHILVNRNLIVIHCRTVSKIIKKILVKQRQLLDI